MENQAKGALAAFIADWLASNGHGSVESLIPRVEQGVDLLLEAVFEEAESRMPTRPVDIEEPAEVAPVDEAPLGGRAGSALTAEELDALRGTSAPAKEAQQ